MAGIKLYLELYQHGLFKNIKSVIEMGSQELHLAPADFENLIRSAGIAGAVKEKFASSGELGLRSSSKPFFEMLGVEKYSCVDLNKELGAIALDLNLPLGDRSLYGEYDLVTDPGCNEHAFKYRRNAVSCPAVP